MPDSSEPVISPDDSNENADKAIEGIDLDDDDDQPLDLVGKIRQRNLATDFTMSLVDAAFIILSGLSG